VVWGCAPQSHPPGAPEASSISSGLPIFSKIVGHGALTVFGHAEGALHASTAVIAEGVQMEGELVAQVAVMAELTQQYRSGSGPGPSYAIVTIAN
jgi:hypothetical protein